MKLLLCLAVISGGTMSKDQFDGKKDERSNAEWQHCLTPKQYEILRMKGTERPFQNEYADNKREGTYVCAACGLPLYSSLDKYDSGTGWPSFTKPVAKENVSYKEDRKLASTRTEVLCARCGGHLGHVFDDGPAPTGKRFCMNSAALKFEEKHK